MTRREVFRALPDIIDHPQQGYGELEVLSDSLKTKGMCYRHNNGNASYGTYAKTWQELYEDLGTFLIKEGYKVEGMNIV